MQPRQHKSQRPHVGGLPPDIKLRVGLRLEETKGVNIRLEVTPLTESFKDLPVHIIPISHVMIILGLEYLWGRIPAP